MKPLLVALVVANVLLFGWLRGWMAPLGGDGREPARIDRQVEPDRLRVTPPARTPAAPGKPPGSGAGGGSSGASFGASPGGPSPGGASAGPASGAAAAGSATAGGAAAGPGPSAEPGGTTGAPPPPASGAAPGAPAAASETPVPDAPKLVAALRAARCAEIGPIAEADAMRVQATLDAIRDDLVFAMRRLDETTSWWVYVPPAPVDLGKRLADLRARGVTDTYVMPDGPWRGAISLGLFRQEELAVALQRSIVERGIRNVRVAPRGPGPGRVTMQVRPVPEPVAAELARLRVASPDMALRPCPTA